MTTQKARLVLEDGKIYHGRVFAKGKESLGEVIFNTSMVGYQEVLTDPSYKGQIVLMTYPLIGSYGINSEDIQSKKLHLEALVIKEYIENHSNWRATKSLKEYLEENNVLGVEGFDTRTITRNLRETGSKLGLLTTSEISDEELREKIRSATDPIKGQNLAGIVSTTEVYKWDAPKEKKFEVAVLDCGVKYEILNQLKEIGAQCTVYPFNTPSSEILEKKYDGVLLSNGPGDPENVKEAVQTVKELLGQIPMFGICLGHQILSIAVDIPIKKLEFGHHGMNHPIKNKITGEVEITSQNHIYCSDESALKDGFEVTHTNLNDQTIAGIRSVDKKAFSVQYHPEAAPGPRDSHYLFEEFAHLMTHKKFSDESNSKDGLESDLKKKELNVSVK